MIVQNDGFLSTNVTERAKANGVSKPVTAAIDIGEEGQLVAGQQEQELGHLEGRAGQYESMTYMAAYGNQTKARVEWVVRAPSRGDVTIRLTSTKAGSVSRTVKVGSTAGRGGDND